MKSRFSLAGHLTRQNYSEEVAANIDREMRSMIDQAYKGGRAHHRTPGRADRAARTLLERETLEAPEFEAVLAGEELPAPEGDYASGKQGDSDTRDKAGTSEQNKPEATEKVEKPGENAQSGAEEEPRE